MKYILISGLFLFSCASKTTSDHTTDSVSQITTTTEQVPPESSPEEALQSSAPDTAMEKLNREFAPFIPGGYEILDNTEGDLNLDSIKDRILVLRKLKEDTINSSDPERPLLILTGEGNGKYKLEARNDKTVFCYHCGGMMGDPFMGITIKNGYFSVEHYGGSSWRWSRIVTYKYSKEEKKWFLNRDGTESFHAGDEEGKVETDIKTPKDFGKIEFKDVNIYVDKVK